jgi:hypothetical protein
MAPYSNFAAEINQARQNGFVPPPPPLRQESQVPPVLQQTTQLYQAYQPKKEEK